MSHICDISALHGSEWHYEALHMLVIGVRHKPMNMAKMVDGLSAVDGGSKRAQPPPPPRKLLFQWPRPRALVGTWGIFLGVKPEIVGVAGYQHAAGSFCLPQFQLKEGEHWIWFNPMIVRKYSSLYFLYSGVSAYLGLYGSGLFNFGSSQSCLHAFGVWHPYIFFHFIAWHEFVYLQIIFKL